MSKAHQSTPSRSGSAASKVVRGWTARQQVPQAVGGVQVLPRGMATPRRLLRLSPLLLYIVVPVYVISRPTVTVTAPKKLRRADHVQKYKSRGS